MRYFCMVFATAGLLASASGVQAGHLSGHGSVRHSERYRTDRRQLEIEVEDLNALQLQREAIAEREEARREKGRQIRREEIDQIRKEKEEYSLEFQQAILDASRAALRAPRFYFYRRPGFMTRSLPTPHQVIDIGGSRYFYHRGIYYRHVVSDYIVVTAPVGAVIDSLPEGNITLRDLSPTLYYYYYGSFYRKDAQGYRAIDPPPGLIVSYLPDGYASQREDDVLHYVFGSVHYQPYYQNGIIVYKVTE